MQFLIILALILICCMALMTMIPGWAFWVIAAMILYRRRKEVGNWLARMLSK